MQGGGTEDEESEEYTQANREQQEENSVSRTMNGECFQNKEVADSDNGAEILRRGETGKRNLIEFGQKDSRDPSRSEDGRCCHEMSGGEGKNMSQ